ncbi:MAG: CPBP family glutamic-type intramembrane protease [bacterium JZ-2024 1]
MIFTAYHADPNLEGVYLLFPLYFVAGLIFAGAYRITGNLIPTIVTHSVGNVVARGEIYVDAARYFLEKLAGS